MDFGALKKKKEIPKKPPKPLTPESRGPVQTKKKRKKGPSPKDIADFTTVIGQLMVNVHTTQRETLKRITGSHITGEVRQWIIDKFTEAIE